MKGTFVIKMCAYTKEGHKMYYHANYKRFCKYAHLLNHVDSNLQSDCMIFDNAIDFYECQEKIKKDPDIFFYCYKVIIAVKKGGKNKQLDKFVRHCRRTYTGAWVESSSNNYQPRPPIKMTSIQVINFLESINYDIWGKTI